jgi:acetyl esterase/lipase
MPVDPPFVLDPPSAGVEVTRRDDMDIYRGPADGPRPTVVFVPGPIPAAMPTRPRDWAVYRGYGRLSVAHGLVAVVTALPYYDAQTDAAACADALERVLETVRALPEVDGDRIALWVFSAGGWMVGRWLSASPDWLRCLALTYPVLQEDPVVPGRPVVLTRVGLESPKRQATVDAFLARAKDAGADVRVIDVPDGQHGFDVLDHTEQSRAAVVEAMTAVADAVNR